MKPPDRFIKWLQSHPAVWEALQEEWEPAAGDSVVSEVLGLTGIEWWSDPKDQADDIMAEGWTRWIPSLGQLVRMLQNEWSDWENRLEIWILKETAGNKGAKAVIRPKDSYRLPVESSEWEEEPEIACAALWAKVKGVE